MLNTVDETDPDQLYDMGEDDEAAAPLATRELDNDADQQLYDMGTADSEFPENSEMFGFGDGKATEQVADEDQMLYGNVDTGAMGFDDNDDSGAGAGRAGSNSGSAMAVLTAADVGKRVRVQGCTCLGTLAFVGEHQQRKTPRVGVVLDEPLGRNNGTVDGHAYFSCADGHGVLCVPSKVSLACARE